MSEKLNKARALRGALHSLHMTHAAYPRPLVAEYCAYNERRAVACRPILLRGVRVSWHRMGCDPYNATLGHGAGVQP